jgi:acylphosphatase
MRKKIIFYGQVQGVGFRYAAKMLAEKYNLVGWVENNDDGGVTLIAEGAEENIESLINNLKDYFQDNIENIKEDIEKDEGLIDFKIK